MAMKIRVTCGCGVVKYHRWDAVGTMKRCDNCGAKYIVPEQPSILPGCLTVLAIGGVGLLSCMCVVGVIGTMVRKTLPQNATAPAAATEAPSQKSDRLAKKDEERSTSDQRAERLAIERQEEPEISAAEKEARRIEAVEVRERIAAERKAEAEQKEREAAEKKEADAARKLGTAKKLKKDNPEAYTRRLKELVEDYGDTKAGEEAAKLMKSQER